MEVSSNNRSSSANSCNNNEGTRASLRLKRKREQSYEAYHENPQAKRDKVKAAFDKDRAKKTSTNEVFVL